MTLFPSKQKKLESEVAVLTAALKAVDSYHAAVERVGNCAYKSDAKKMATDRWFEMADAIRSAKNHFGGEFPPVAETT